METLAAVALSALAFALVGYPLVRGQSPSQPEMSFEEAELEEMLSDRESAYDALAELDFDHKAGTLDDADFQNLRGRYLRRAALVLKEIDEVKREAPRAEGRRRGRAVTLEPEPSRGGRGARTACPRCGADVQPEDSFCVACGGALARGCPACGAPYESDHRFCTSCGASLGDA